jgi:hypothetical protein
VYGRVSFTAKGFGIERVRDDYKQLSRLLLAILRISSGGCRRTTGSS